jgi:hypothetical protein
MGGFANLKLYLRYKAKVAVLNIKRCRNVRRYSGSPVSGAGTCLGWLCGLDNPRRFGYLSASDRGSSSAGRAPRSQRGGRRFDPALLHPIAGTVSPGPVQGMAAQPRQDRKVATVSSSSLCCGSAWRYPTSDLLEFMLNVWADQNLGPSGEQCQCKSG